MEKTQVSLNSDKNSGYLGILYDLFLEQETFQAKVEENKNINFSLRSFFAKIVPL